MSKLVKSNSQCCKVIFANCGLEIKELLFTIITINLFHAEKY